MQRTMVFRRIRQTKSEIHEEVEVEIDRRHVFSAGGRINALGFYSLLSFLSSLFASLHLSFCPSRFNIQVRSRRSFVR